MVSNHFPALYGHRWNWALLLVIVASGAAVRHILNVRFTYPPWKLALSGTIVASVIALFVLMTMASNGAQVDGATRATVSSAAASRPVTFAEARHVIDRRCAACHSAQPSDLTFGGAPAGVMFDTPEQIASRASRIRERAIVTRTMPPANKTHITDDERAILARWIALGAPVR
jgi:uncharacterized membrane protein